MNNFIDKEQDL